MQLTTTCSTTNLLRYIPRELCRLIAIHLTPRDILNLCLTESYINNVVINDEFWYLKFIKDYGIVDDRLIHLISDEHSKSTIISQINVIPYKQLYIDFNTAWLLSDKYGCRAIKYNYEKNSRKKCGVNNINISESYASIVTLGGDVFIGITPNNWRTGNTEILNFEQIPITKIQKIACADHGIVMVDIQNNVWVSGFFTADYDCNKNHTEIIKLVDVKAKQISCGSKHAILIDIDDDILALGNNVCGQLGLGDNTNRQTLTKIHDIKGKFISCGPYNTAIIDFNNDVWIFGENNNGALGLLNAPMQCVNPTKIPDLKFKSISMSNLHSIGIDLHDNAWGFGSNAWGQLGIGQSTNNNYIKYGPTKLLDMDVEQVVVSGCTSAILDKRKNIWICGNWSLGRSGGVLQNMIDAVIDQKGNINLWTKLQGFKAKSIYGGRSNIVGFVGAAFY